MPRKRRLRASCFAGVGEAGLAARFMGMSWEFGIKPILPQICPNLAQGKNETIDMTNPWHFTSLGSPRYRLDGDNLRFGLNRWNWLVGGKATPNGSYENRNRNIVVSVHEHI